MQPVVLESVHCKNDLACDSGELTVETGGTRREFVIQGWCTVRNTNGESYLMTRVRYPFRFEVLTSNVVVSFIIVLHTCYSSVFSPCSTCDGRTTSSTVNSPRSSLRILKWSVSRFFFIPYFPSRIRFHIPSYRRNSRHRDPLHV